MKEKVMINEFRWVQFPEGTFIYELEPDGLVFIWYLDERLYLSVEEPPDLNMEEMTARKLSLYHTLEIPQSMLERIGFESGKAGIIPAVFDQEKQLITIESLRKTVFVPYEEFKKRRRWHGA